MKRFSKILVIGFMTLAGASFSASAMEALNQQLLNKFDVSAVVNHIKEFAHQINFNQSPEMIAMQIKNILQNQVPANVLNVSPSQIASTAQAQAVVNQVKAALPQIKQRLATVSIFLRYPSLLIDLLRDVIYPRIQANLAAVNPQFNSAAANIVQFLNANKANAIALAAAFESYVKNLITRINDLEMNIQNVSADQALNYIQRFVQNNPQIEAKVAEIYPQIVQFAQDHKQQIAQALNQFKNVDINAVRNQAQNLLQGF